MDGNKLIEVMDDIFVEKVILTPKEGADKDRSLFQACKYAFDNNDRVELMFDDYIYHIDPWQIIEDIEETKSKNPTN